jgi:hypothetical protein
MEEVSAPLLLIAGGVRVFSLANLNTSSAYRIEGCLVMVYGFTARPDRKKPMLEECETETRVRRKWQRGITDTRCSRAGATTSPTLLLCL